MTRLAWEAVMAWRVERQGLLARAPASGWEDVVRRICGLHGQVQSCAELTLWARADDLPADTVKRALWEQRSLVRTWAMRGTIHLLAAGELGLYAGAQGAQRPRYETASWRKAFGMSSGEAVAVLDAIRSALDGEPLTRDELADRVGATLGDARLGDAVRGSFGTMPKLAALRGDVCFAPPRGQKVRFTRPDRWLDDFALHTPPRDALVEVLRRYLAVYGPASREQFARWFGMPSAAQAGKLIAALGDEVCAVDIEGHAAHMLAADVDGALAARPRGTVSLLPGFDQYVVAAPRFDSPVLADADRDRVFRAQGWISPVLLVDGRIAGVWQHRVTAGTLELAIEPFADPGGAVRAAAEEDARRLAAYLDADDLDISWA